MLSTSLKILLKLGRAWSEHNAVAVYINILYSEQTSASSNLFLFIFLKIKNSNAGVWLIFIYIFVTQLLILIMICCKKYVASNILSYNYKYLTKCFKLNLCVHLYIFKLTADYFLYLKRQYHKKCNLWRA